MTQALLFQPYPGGGAKMPALHILAISQSFQVGNQHNEAPCRKKNLQKFGKLVE